MSSPRPVVLPAAAAVVFGAQAEALDSWLSRTLTAERLAGMDPERVLNLLAARQAVFEAAEASRRSRVSVPVAGSEISAAVSPGSATRSGPGLSPSNHDGLGTAELAQELGVSARQARNIAAAHGRRQGGRWVIARSVAEELREVRRAG